VTDRSLLPSVAADLPDDWTVFGSASVRSPSGLEIRLWLDGQRHPTDLQAIADRMEASARDEVAVIGDVAACELQLGERAACARQFTFERGGNEMVGRIVCRLHDDRALIATASWRADGDLDGVDEMDTLIAGVRLPRPSAPPDPIEASRWSPTDLAVVAMVMGETPFPTVGIEWLAGLPSGSVDAVVDTVTRSLIARRLLVRAEDGSAEVVASLRSVVDAALLAELAIDVAHMTAQGTQHTWFGAGPGRVIRIAVTDDGARRIDELAPDDVPDAVLAAAGAVWDSANDDLEPPQGSITTSTLADPSSDLIALTRISTSWMDDGRHHGGVFFWACYASGGGWLAEPNGEGWILHKAEGLRATLLAHLPDVTNRT
jgi:hypothetical protein